MDVWVDRWRQIKEKVGVCLCIHLSCYSVIFLFHYKNIVILSLRREDLENNKSYTMKSACVSKSHDNT